MASRPSSTSGPTRGDAREAAVARVIEFTPRERSLGVAANDNASPVGRRLLQVVGTGLMFALVAGGGVYLYLL
ncbi:MAG: hypothetical protein HY060_22965 [Proteobacteria bacterium]|nr:hypothetical protein [Pseudomonadota bacterium]